MGDFLCTTVMEVEKGRISSGGMKMLLSVDDSPGETGVQYEIPVEVDVRPHDKVIFYHGHVTSGEPLKITHRDYTHVEITRPVVDLAGMEIYLKQPVDPTLILSADSKVFVTYEFMRQALENTENRA
jgi:hypothetical protein